MTLFFCFPASTFLLVYVFYIHYLLVRFVYKALTWLFCWCFSLFTAHTSEFNSLAYIQLKWSEPWGDNNTALTRSPRLRLVSEPIYVRMRILNTLSSPFERFYLFTLNYIIYFSILTDLRNIWTKKELGIACIS